MAETSKKYKVGELAKDFGLKNKDVIDLFAKHGFAGKTHTSALEDEEISLFLEALTQENQIDITAYFKTFDDKKKAKKEEERKKAEEAQKAADEARRKQREAQNPQKKKAPAQNQQPQKQRSKTEVRVVDTRGTSNVDLGKYDEKLLSYDAGDNAQTGKQKIKKKNKFQTPDQKGGKNGKMQGKQQPQKPQSKPKPVQLTISVPDEITVSELASRMKQTVGNVVKKLMSMGVMAGINDVIDFDTAYLVADEFKIVVNKEVILSLEDRLIDNTEDAPETLEHRAPVVVVMGHVDHGKTSLLDAIRDAHVTAGEAGGITQHIGAYSVHVHGEDITFLDTPGHEAFTAMRARGANMTDIAILVVAADDGIMPQTVEAINHAKAAGTPIIVAINKMDRPGANPDKIMTDLTNYELVPEAWGGDTICMPISALKRQGIDELLDMVILSAEMLELKANPNRRAKGTVIEARLDKTRGPIATLLVQNGTLNQGDIVIAGTAVGRVRVMTNDKGRTVKTAGPSVPVEITGLAEVPVPGDEFNAVTDERMARELVEQRKQAAKDAAANAMQKVTLDNLFARMQEGEMKELPLIVKADVQGSAEAVKASLEKLTNEEVRVRVIHTGAGAINESDVLLASTAGAIIVGFNVRPDSGAQASAQRTAVDMRFYRVIYDAIDEIESAMKGMLAPKYEEAVIGHAEVRMTYKVSSVGTIAGCMVKDGKVSRAAKVRVLRDNIVIHEGEVGSLQRFKDAAKEVTAGYECGMSILNYNDIKENDIFECFVMEEVKR